MLTYCKAMGGRVRGKIHASEKGEADMRINGVEGTEGDVATQILMLRSLKCELTLFPDAEDRQFALLFGQWAAIHEVVEQHLEGVF